MDQDRANEKTEDISRMILDYLRRNPHAGDTLEGITRYWLERERVEMSVHEVQKALEHLSRKGAISSRKMKDGRAIYGMSNE